ncbi:MAG: TPR end-of-group domain-containing protein, partial [Gaiellales bacterium]
GRALVAEHPQDPTLLYNLACCESLAGRPGDAIEHLRAAIDINEEFRPMAAADSDFDPIRDQSAFSDLVADPARSGGEHE